MPGRAHSRSDWLKEAWTPFKSSLIGAQCPHTCMTALFPLPQGPRDRELHPGALPPGLGGRGRLLPVWPALLGHGRRHRHHQRSRRHRDGHVRWAQLTLGLPQSPGVRPRRLDWVTPPDRGSLTSSESLLMRGHWDSGGPTPPACPLCATRRENRQSRGSDGGHRSSTTIPRFHTMGQSSKHTIR